MKNDKVTAKSKEKKSGPGSDPKNKFKKGTRTAAAINNLITSPTEKFKARSAKFDIEGTEDTYEEGL